MHFCKRELQAAGETLQFELSNLVTLNDIISHYQIRAQATSPSRLILETEQTFLIPQTRSSSYTTAPKNQSWHQALNQIEIQSALALPLKLAQDMRQNPKQWETQFPFSEKVSKQTNNILRQYLDSQKKLSLIN